MYILCHFYIIVKSFHANEKTLKNEKFFHIDEKILESWGGGGVKKGALMAP